MLFFLSECGICLFDLFYILRSIDNWLWCKGYGNYFVDRGWLGIWWMLVYLFKLFIVWFLLFFIKFYFIGIIDFVFNILF